MPVPRATLRELSETFGNELRGPRARLFTARDRLALLAQIVETKVDLMLVERVGYDEPDIRAQEGLHLFVRDLIADLDATFEAMRRFSDDLYALAKPDASTETVGVTPPAPEPGGVH
jgi:hypothetical protein